MLLALTRAVPPSIGRCELTHLARAPIDVERAAGQHREYEDALRALGCTVRRLPPEPELADSVFVEDTAVVLDEVAVLTRPGAVSRRAETASVAGALRPHRRLLSIEPPGTLEGGDVLRIGRDLYIGLSARSNPAGVRQLRDLLRPFGYTVHGVAVRGCLHLKTAVTRVAEGTVLVNPDWVDVRELGRIERIEVHPVEPFAANALPLGETLLYPAAHPRTRERLEARGLTLQTVDADELAKAEAGLTCCSLVFEA